MKLYCDYNATTPMRKEVFNAVVDAMKRFWGNSFSPHSLGRESGIAVENAREKVAKLVSCPARSVRFTSGATESNSWLLSHYQRREKRIMVSAVEHPSVLQYGDCQLSTDENGVIRLELLERELNTGTVGIVSVMAANNETGVIQPIQEIFQCCQRYGVPFHCDASQIYSKISMPVAADFITLSAHKFGGPKGVGALVLNREIDALLQGGPQERGSRAGTHNIPAIVGMGVAASLCETPYRFDTLPLEKQICKLGGRVLGSNVNRLPNTVSALFSTPGDLVVFALDLRGVQASTGSACSSGASQDSHVLRAMGEAGTPVRFSLGPDTDIVTLCDILEDVLTSMEAECV
ncbi:MAG: cysteine desulfurase family protein [Myxococcota bacterium]|nr:cysteine desulfurase family protein [Myxococcota bacterium]